MIPSVVWLQKFTDFGTNARQASSPACRQSCHRACHQIQHVPDHQDSCISPCNPPHMELTNDYQISMSLREDRRCERYSTGGEG
jgi:hypothetical protein